LYEDRFTIKGARQRLKDELKQMRQIDAGRSRGRPFSFRGRASGRPRQSGPNIKLGNTLFHLRNEVDELLKILGR
jgi:hypothetical protein